MLVERPPKRSGTWQKKSRKGPLGVLLGRLELGWPPMPACWDGRGSCRSGGDLSREQELGEAANE
jgi:hypothetical protein